MVLLAGSGVISSSTDAFVVSSDGMTVLVILKSAGNGVLIVPSSASVPYKLLTVQPYLYIY